MTVVTSIHNTSRLPSMVELLDDALCEMHDTAMDIGKIDKACANVAMGFSSGAIISLKALGHVTAANVFQRLAQTLEQDWRQFQPAIQEAHQALMALSRQ